MYEKLKPLRQERKMTQQQVAKMLGVDRTTYSLYETGKVNLSFSKALALAKIFEIPITDLIDPPKGTPELPLDLSKEEALHSPGALGIPGTAGEFEFFLRFRMLEPEMQQKIIDEVFSAPLRPEYSEIRPVKGALENAEADAPTPEEKKG